MSRQQNVALAIGLGLLLVGVTLLVISISGLVFSWGSTKARPATAVVASSTALSTATAPAASSTPTTAAQPETVEQFLPLFAAALRTGDTNFLVGRLNPHVIDAYGEPNCRATVARMTDPTASFTINATSGPAPWTWTESGSPVPIDQVYTVSVTRVALGKSSVQDIHLALVQDHLTWFRSCASAP